MAGTQVAEGDYLCMLYASGNRDERVFGDDASRFDVRRRTNPVHLAFGFGEHVCLGASLARLEARIFLEELLARFPTYAVTGPAERVLSTTVAGIRWLPVVLAPGVVRWAAGRRIAGRRGPVQGRPGGAHPAGTRRPRDRR